MKIGVLTYFKSHNYGSFLQGYALTMWLRSLGYDAELINYNMNKAVNRFSKPKMGRDPIRYYYRLMNYRMFNNNLRIAPCSTVSIVTDDVEILRSKIYGQYDLIVVGSDELWRTDNFRGFPTPYWLEGDFGCRKCSYAVSSLSLDDNISNEFRHQIKSLLSDFDYLSVRDNFTQKKFQNLLDGKKNVEIACDPTFMYDFKPDSERGRKLLKDRYHINTNKKIIGFMNNDRNFALYLKNKLGKSTEIIAVYDYILGLKNSLTATPFDWIDIIAGLDFMVTSYFHGTCFSMKASTPFFAVDYSAQNCRNSKIGDLLYQTNLQDRFTLKEDKNYFEKCYKSCIMALDGVNVIDFATRIDKLTKNSNSFLEYLKYLS